MASFGITLLTNISQEDLVRMGIQRSIEDQVVLMAMLAKVCGLSGIVTSGHEICKIKESCGEEFMVVTPGIRLETSLIHDQKRIMTPQEASKAGADFIVVGRPILEAKNKFEEARKIRSKLQAQDCSKTSG